MVRAAIALGSNLPSPWATREEALEEAVVRVGTLGKVTAVSGFYDTEPVGYADQPRFLNAALLLETELGPEALMQGLLGVEGAMGRERAGVVAKGPRVIDLDLLLYGDEVVVTEQVTVPHPRMRERRFVLEPLAEIAGAMLDPGSGLTVRELLARLGDDCTTFRQH